MEKSKRRTMATVILMIFIAVIVVMSYYLTNRKMLLFTFNKKKTQVQILLDKDFNNYYPSTPREVVKLYSTMVKVLHSGIKDNEVKELALKMRELYDDELLQKNPEADYLQNVFLEIAASKKNERKITNTLIVNKNMEKQKVVNGKEYATIYISYTIYEKNKHSENWKYLLRKNEKDQWKILGWEYVPNKKK